MLTNAKAVHRPHDHRRCVNSALSRARALCSERSARLTPLREAVLRLLWQSHRPLGAYQIQEQLSQINAKPVAAPTVYRALEFFLELGLIHRIASLNAYIGCPFPDSDHSDMFLICSDCGNAAEVSHSHINQLLEQTARRADFALATQSLELYGRCGQCCELAENNAVAMR